MAVVVRLKKTESEEEVAMVMMSDVLKKRFNLETGS